MEHDEQPATQAAPVTEPEAPDVLKLLEDARGKADEHWDLVLRARADLENQRRRHERDLESAHKYALERFALELLPVMDSLELGLATAETSDRALREGMELTLKQLAAAFSRFALAAINPVGEKFNPQLHQAMAAQESTEVEPNIVLTVYRKGYLLHERVIRPAMVIVSKAVETGTEQA
ncbi:MAG: nucleotide exchange factor GrpE [Gammaproteobacteria bacterium]|nr:nucleotide exchange factor GrpE [Gammaproteobacteria bacterium]